MKSCAVLDLDSTLVNMFGDEKTWDYMQGETRPKVLAATLNIKVNGNFMWGAKRPYCDSFLKACFQTFDLVGIWSAGTTEYVNEIVIDLFGAGSALNSNERAGSALDLTVKDSHPSSTWDSKKGDLIPSFIWSKPMCEDSAVRYDHTPDLMRVKQKPLSKLLKAFPQIDPKRIMIFDDMRDVCEQDALQHIHIPGFNGTYDSIHSEDDTLLKLSSWLKTDVKTSRDYSKLKLPRNIKH